MEAEGDLESDLMALGLGELPADLLEPIEPEAVAADATPEEPAGELELADTDDMATLLEPEAEETAEGPVAEPAADELVSDAALAELAEELAAEEGGGEGVADEPTAPAAEDEAEADVPEAPEADGESAVAEESREAEPFADLAAEMEALAADVEAEATEEELPEAESEIEAGPDLSDILESLEGDADDTSGAPPGSAEMIQTDTFEDESIPASDGVISTDAYLADIGGDDLDVGLSSGLGDELSALTGAQGASRPTASVNKLPEEGEKLELHRDQTVDKELVKKIIDGIEKL
jgi:hypothetical protein